MNETNIPDLPHLTVPEKPIQRCTRCGVIVEEGRLLCDVCRYIGSPPQPIPFYPYSIYWPPYTVTYPPIYTYWSGSAHP